MPILSQFPSVATNDHLPAQNPASAPAPTLKELLDRARPIAYRQPYAMIAGSINAGLMLAQGLHWSPRGGSKDGWFYKTQYEWQQEIGLTRFQQEAARRKLRAIRSPSGAPVWLEKKAGQNRKLYYFIDHQAFAECLQSADWIAENQQTGVRKTSRPVCGKLADRSASFPQSITKMTSEMTSEKEPPPTSSSSFAIAEPQQQEEVGLQSNHIGLEPEQPTATTTALPVAQQAITETDTNPTIQANALPPSSENPPSADLVPLATAMLIEVGVYADKAAKLVKLPGMNFETLRDYVVNWQSDKTRPGAGALVKRIERGAPHTPITDGEYMSDFCQRYRTPEEIRLDDEFAAEQALEPVSVVDMIEPVESPEPVAAPVVAPVATMARLTEHGAIWRAVLDELAQCITPGAFANLRDTKPVNTSGADYIIAVPAKALDRLRVQFAGKIERSLKRFTDGPFTLSFQPMEEQLRH